MKDTIKVKKYSYDLVSLFKKVIEMKIRGEKKK